jgi:hypothetical protein
MPVVLEVLYVLVASIPTALLYYIYIPALPRVL